MALHLTLWLPVGRCTAYTTCHFIQRLIAWVRDYNMVASIEQSFETEINALFRSKYNHMSRGDAAVQLADFLPQSWVSRSLGVAKRQLLPPVGFAFLNKSRAYSRKLALSTPLSAVRVCISKHIC